MAHQRTERIAIDRVFLNEENITSAETDQARELVDLTMTTRERDVFHEELRDLGYRVGEGETGEINQFGEVGTIFQVFRVNDESPRPQAVARITTYKVDTEDLR